MSGGIGMRESFIFNNISSNDLGLIVQQRAAPTPEEQTVTDTIPYRQGTTDFSSLDGERFFQNRSITYTCLVDGNFTDRRNAEAYLKSKLMPPSKKPLNDNYDPQSSYWIATCTSISVEDQLWGHYFTATIVFSCYPFLYWSIPEGNDEWDTFNFDYDVSQDTSFTVSGTDVVPLINPGGDTIYPKITVTGNITVTVNGYTVSFSAGTYTNTLIRLEQGANSVALSGSGTINFQFYKEVMV